jgi:hypothetical protein
MRNDHNDRQASLRRTSTNPTLWNTTKPPISPSYDATNRYDALAAVTRCAPRRHGAHQTYMNVLQRNGRERRWLLCRYDQLIGICQCRVVQPGAKRIRVVVAGFGALLSTSDRAHDTGNRCSFVSKVERNRKLVGQEVALHLLPLLLLTCTDNARCLRAVSQCACCCCCWSQFARKKDQYGRCVGRDGRYKRCRVFVFSLFKCLVSSNHILLHTCSVGVKYT